MEITPFKSDQARNKHFRLELYSNIMCQAKHVGDHLQKTCEFTVKVAPRRLALGGPGLGEPWRDTLGALGSHYNFRVCHNFVGCS